MRSTRWRWPIVLGAGILLGFTARADEPTFELRPNKQGDLLTVNKEGTVFTVQSRTGIGSAMLRPTKGQWPKMVRFRFQLGDGKPFQGLEGFKLTTERFKVEGSLKESGKLAYFVANKEGKFERQGTAAVEVKQGKEGIEAALPADFLRGAEKVELSWVDFYR